MTTFLDGPATGQRLMLKRAPIFLRAVQDAAGNWDALDQLEDEPAAGERIVVYQLAAPPSWAHVLKRGRDGDGNYAGSGFYTVAEYQVLPTQPDDQDARENWRWRAWNSLQPLPPGIQSGGQIPAGM